jgi:hypothetical protein
MAQGSTQPLTEMSTRNLPRGKGRPARKADAICEPIVLENVGTSTSNNLMGLHYFFFVTLGKMEGNLSYVF